MRKSEAEKALPDTIVLAPDETWPEHKVATLTRLLHMGATMATLRHMLKVSARAINDRIERYRLPPVRKSMSCSRGGWTEAEIADIRWRREQGQPNAEIIASYGISLSTLNNLRKTYGMDKKRVKFTLGKRIDLTYNPLSVDEMDEVCRLWESGVFSENIRELFNISGQCLYRIVKFRGVKRPDWYRMHGAHNWTEEEVEHLFTLADRGLSSTEIADDLGLSWATVAKKVRELGLALPTNEQVKARNYGKRYAVLDPQVKRLRLAGLTGNDIMEKLGITAGMLGDAIERLVAAGEIPPRWAAKPWRPTKADILMIAEGFKLHLRPITIALQLGAETEHHIIAAARDEGFVHPCYRYPPLHVLRPEVLLHHLFDHRLRAHLDDVLTVYRRAFDDDDINRALSRFDRARETFPNIAPWPHPSIRARAADMRARARAAASAGRLTVAIAA